MKHLFYLIFALSPLLGISQEKNTTIKVSARAVHTDPTPTYKTTVSLSTAFSSYVADGMDLEELKSRYKKALESNNISWSELRENPYGFGFETMGYDNDGVIYEFTTTSTEKMRAFLKTRSQGVQRLNTMAVLDIDPEESKKLYETALKDAKTKASTIATTLGKELGNILLIEDSQYIDKQVETTIFNDRPVGVYIHFLQVVFAVK